MSSPWHNKSPNLRQFLHAAKNIYGYQSLSVVHTTWHFTTFYRVAIQRKQKAGKLSLAGKAHFVHRFCVAKMLLPVCGGALLASF